jgi:cytochrome P450
MRSPTVSDLEHVDLTSAENLADPFGYFADLVEHAPVIYNRCHHAWLVSGFDLVESCLRNPAIGSDRITPYVSSNDRANQARLERMFETLSRWMVFVEPPDHTRLRMLVQRPFTPKRVAMLEERATEIASDLADRVAWALKRDGEVDLVSQFCVPYPGKMIAEFLGVPVDDGDKLRGWAEVLGLFINGVRGNAERDERVAAAMLELEDYLRRHIGAYRSSPQDNIFSGLVASEGEQSLSDTELIATCTLLLDAGYKTVQNALANALLTIMEHPPAWSRLAADAALMPAAVEEFLRYMGPGNLIIRRASADVELDGHSIRAGERIYLVPAAANRDPRRFDRPHELILDRTPNQHIAFGHGIHYCLGAALARMEMRVGLAALVAQLPEIELAAEPATLSWHRALILHGVERLPARPAAPSGYR